MKDKFLSRNEITDTNYYLLEGRTMSGKEAYDYLSMKGFTSIEAFNYLKLLIEEYFHPKD